MERWNDLDDVPTDLGATVVTLGNFDGVHAGHRAVLGRVTELARAKRALAVAITFHPHPMAVLFPDRAPQLVTSLDQRLDLMAAVGLDATLVMRFTPEVAQWSPEHFVREVLVDRLHTAVVVVGADTRFGHRNSGDVQTLRELGVQLGFEVEVLADLTPQASPDRWSSTGVREALAAGDVDEAARALGRPHRVTGTVVHGDHRGRELGFPTANLGPDSEGMVPADGVYAGWLLRPELDETEQRVLPAAVSIGTNPTFDGTQRRVEAYVLDRTDLDLYGERIGLELVQRLRPTLRFEDVDRLVAQMRLDVQECREVLGQGVVPRSYGPTLVVDEHPSTD
ncbi:bifunctional riboflavin kinase/FAD synthetase [Angustibacter sp. McL0619]|uniref:bifunctional riboflavin kinase/FAD synthetase n=1 Tax=Angustibacter sp. McL0619 TaxID=3415676 RepID=UPI003CEC3F3C